MTELLNKIHHEDCLITMSELKDNSVDLIISDPPYFSTNIKEVGDNQWKTEEDYIQWHFKLIEEFARILKSNGSMYLFHNNANIMIDVIMYAKQTELTFRNQITWNKFPTHNNFSRVIKTYGNNRNYGQTFTEYVYFLTKQKDYFPTPFARIMKEEMNNQGITGKQIAELQLSKNGNITGWVANKLKGTQLPSKIQWEKMCELFNIDNNYEDLVKQFEKERYRFNQKYIEFTGTNLEEQKELIKPFSTIWEYTLEENDKSIHKTPKPIKMIDSILEISSNPGELVYIPFGGSGNEIISCIKNNRNWIASELQENWVNLANSRIEEYLQWK